MAMAKLPIYVKRDNEKGELGNWQHAWIESDQTSGAITLSSSALLGSKWSITLRPDQIAKYEIQMISDVAGTAGMYGGLLGYGISRLMAQWAKMPVLYFEQPSAAQGERSVMLYAQGYLPRKLTKDIALKVSALLTERGLRVMPPNLNDPEPWKFPWVPTLIGVGLFFAVLLVLCVALSVLANSIPSS